METDDDIRYLVIGLLIAEQYGNDFTPDNVAGIWQTYLPAFQCCTAERQAYINSLNAEIQDEAARWEYYRRYLNPCLLYTSSLAHGTLGRECGRRSLGF